MSVWRFMVVSALVAAAFISLCGFLARAGAGEVAGADGGAVLALVLVLAAVLVASPGGAEL